MAALAGVLTAPAAPRARDAAQGAIASCVTAGVAGAARCLLDRVPAGTLEEALFVDPALPGAVLPLIAGALADPDLGDRLDVYVADAARARTRRLSASGTWSDEQGEMCLRLQLVDADRFVADPPFRARVLRFLPRAFDRSASPALRDQLLYSINTLPGVDYAVSEAIEWGWGAVPRKSLERETPYRADALTFPDDATGSIAASIYSFPGPFLDPVNVTRLMAEMRRLRPQRSLVALVDLPMRTAIGGRAHDAGWTLIETHGRAFSPWPRDPFSVLRRPGGSLTFLVRPNLQRERADDNAMALELVQGLPAVLDAAWGQPLWTRAPVPFHNGQVLLMPDAAWISVHSVGERTLEMLDLPWAPAEGAAPGEWRRYQRAAIEAAAELSALFDRPVKFVHAMPETNAPGTIAAIAGGGGFDLDSLVTLLPQPDGTLHALVGDARMGSALLADAPDADLARFAATYGIAPAPAAELRRGLLAAQESARAAGLARFLDVTAAHLQGQLANVERVPLFFVAVRSLADAGHLRHDDFLITWNNVVLDRVDGARRAEGFGSGLESGDLRVAAAFARAGYALDYLPVLPESVILNGGYRCASQHVRRAD